MTYELLQARKPNETPPLATMAASSTYAMALALSTELRLLPRVRGSKPPASAIRASSSEMMLLVLGRAAAARVKHEWTKVCLQASGDGLRRACSTS